MTQAKTKSKARPRTSKAPRKAPVINVVYRPTPQVVAALDTLMAQYCVHFRRINGRDVPYTNIDAWGPWLYIGQDPEGHDRVRYHPQQFARMIVRIAQHRAA